MGWMDGFEMKGRKMRSSLSMCRVVVDQKIG